MKVTFILLEADLEIKNHKNRIDILYQSLLSILDSPLSKKGYVKIYIQSKNNLIIELSENLRIPRTLERFKKIIIQLLRDRKIKYKDEILMRIVDKIDADGIKVCCSSQGKSFELSDQSYIIYIKMIPRGDDFVENVDLLWSFGDMELAAHVVCSRVCYKFEDFLSLL